MTTDVAGSTALGGPELREMFAAATAWLERHAEAINAINVFPVPDGDTGTNMLLTMRAVMDEADRAGDAGAGDVAAAMARGALIGARGNSGVILSQILRGFAGGLAGQDRVDATHLIRAFQEASDAAYRAVAQPVEGTILTVVRDVSQVGSRNGVGHDVALLLERCVDAAHQSVARTPELLPILAQAGVVDAGGRGFAVILEGALRYLHGQPMDLPAAEPDPAAAARVATLAAHHEDEEPYGYCTEFLLRGDGLDVEAVRSRLERLGTSVLAVGDARLVHVHVHTPDPGAVLSFGVRLGSLDRIKIDNMEEQHRAVAGRADQPPVPAAPAGRVSTVTVLPGDGLADVARSMGATAVVRGGQTMNPSTGEILRAIDDCPTDEVLVLPNNKNVVLAAEQAARLTAKRAAVVPTRTVPQGMAALLALTPDADLDACREAAAQAMAGVRTAEVARAARDTEVRGLYVREGQAIGLIDGDLAVAADTVDAAVRECLGRTVTPETAIVTLYCGADAPDREARDLADALSAEFPGVEIEVVRGGQPHYPYIISVE